MTRVKITFISFVLLLFSLGAMLQLSYAQKPLSPEEEKLLRKTEQQRSAESERAGNYSPSNHLLASAAQIGAVLGLLGLVGLIGYIGLRIVRKNKAKIWTRKDKRRWPRLNLEQTYVNVGVVPIYKQTGQYLSKLLDISQGGVGLELEQAEGLSPGDQVKIKFGHLKFSSLDELSGIIRWAAGNKAGIQFDDLINFSFDSLKSMFLNNDYAYK